MDLDRCKTEKSHDITHAKKNDLFIPENNSHTSLRYIVSFNCSERNLDFFAFVNANIKSCVDNLDYLVLNL